MNIIIAQLNVYVGGVACQSLKRKEARSMTWLGLATAVVVVFFLLFLLYGAAKKQLWALLSNSEKDGNPFKSPAR